MPETRGDRIDHPKESMTPHRRIDRENLSNSITLCFFLKFNVTS